MVINHLLSGMILQVSPIFSCPFGRSPPLNHDYGISNGYFHGDRQPTPNGPNVPPPEISA